MTDSEVQFLRKLSSDKLMLKTKSLVRNETEITLQILFHLQEIERRRLHFERGYQSLHEFCVRYLGYSDGSAGRRIRAARLLREVPELEGKIESGAMNLSTIAQAQSFFRSEEAREVIYSKEQKLEILGGLENKSAREVEQEFLKLSPENLPREKLRPLTETQVELKVVLDQDLIQEFEALRSWLSHSNPNPSYQDLIRKALKIANQEMKKKRLGSERPSAQKNSSNTKLQNVKVASPRKHFKDDPLSERQASTQKLSMLENGQIRSRFISFGVRREIWLRDQGCCTYRDDRTGKVCGSKMRLEVDHVVPFAKGGANTQENLRLVCRQHNAQMAIRHFGRKKMESWIRSW